MSQENLECFIADGDSLDPCCCVSLNFCMAVWHKELYFKRRALETGGELTIPQMPESNCDDEMEGGVKFQKL